MIVVVLSVTPERLRGVLTRWLLEIAGGVYVGHVPTRVRDRLWLRIVEDVGRGRALMVWSTRNEQRLAFRVHNHAWTTVDYDGMTLMRRTTAESQRIAAAKQRSTQPVDHSPSTTRATPGDPAGQRSRTNRSHAGRRRRYRNAVEQRHQDNRPRGNSTD